MQCATKAAVVTAVDAPHCADAGKSPRRADRGGVGVRAAMSPSRTRPAARSAWPAGPTGPSSRLCLSCRPVDGRLDVGIGRATLDPRRPWPPSCSGWMGSGCWSAALFAEQQRAGSSAPSSCVPTVAGTVWRPLVAPASRYPWSLLRRAGDSSEHVRALVEGASSPAGSADWNPAPAREIPFPRSSVFIGGGDKSCTDRPFPRTAERGYLKGMRRATPGGDGHLKSAIPGFGTAVGLRQAEHRKGELSRHLRRSAAVRRLQAVRVGPEMGHEVVNLSTQINSLCIRLS